ncbi:MAG: ComEA family DNA-binding protein [Brevundimonas sp.]
MSRRPPEPSRVARRLDELVAAQHDAVSSAASSAALAHGTATDAAAAFANASDTVADASDDPPRPGWVPATTTALHAVRAGYTAEHGHPVGPAGRAEPRRRVRWAVTWRAAAAAAIALAIVGGGVALRAASVAAGPAVELPVPRAPAGASACGSGCGASAAPTAAPSATAAVVVVHVVGAVRRHGVVRLPVGARAADAIDAAGGPTKHADLDALNLARVLVDGEQLVVPRVGQPASAPVPPTGPTTPGLLDVNTATATELDELPGIGPVLAQNIVDYRAEHRFADVDELDDVPGIGPALLERLRSLVRV